jgi:hypothetical protein
LTIIYLEQNNYDQTVIPVIFLFSIIILYSSAFCQSANPLLEEGVKQYQAENYEEAIEILGKAREQDPQSPIAAFFLVMTYKQTIDLKKSRPQSRRCIKIKTCLKRGFNRICKCTFPFKQTDGIKKWIKVAKE